MYGLVIQVKMDMAREAEARKLLKEVVVPQAKARAGFAKGYWMLRRGGGTCFARCSSTIPPIAREPLPRRSKPKARRRVHRRSWNPSKYTKSLSRRRLCPREGGVLR
jgi:hypothetical protein